VRVDIPAVNIDLADPEMIADPYGHFRELRALGGVVYNEAHGVVLLTSYDAVRTCVVDADSFTTEVETLVGMFGGDTLSTLDRPLHGQMRGIWHDDFKMKHLEARWRDTIYGSINELLDPVVESLRAGEVVDVVPLLCQTIPASIIFDMLGVPSEDREMFRDWNDAIMGTFNALSMSDSPEKDEILRHGHAAQMALFAYSADLLDDRTKSAAGDDLVAVLAAVRASTSSRTAAEAGIGTTVKTGLDDEDFVAQVGQLVFAGQENTANMLANILVTLELFPQQRARVAADRRLIDGAVEEIVRHETSLQVNPRVVRTTAVEIAGASLPADTKLWPLLGCANRDETRWEEPDSCDFERSPKPNLSFGIGMHNCIGMHLARLEMRIFAAAVLERIPNYVVAVDELDYGSHFFSRSPRSVPIALPS
jgi:cytochrome P450